MGEWQNNKANGRGVYNYSNGDKYEGEYEDDEKNGKGYCSVKCRSVLLC
jgi:hypothetical protein